MGFARSASLNEVRPRRPEQSIPCRWPAETPRVVSMKSGLEGRNNRARGGEQAGHQRVSMKSGLEGRNNYPLPRRWALLGKVSMKSGLEGRNNLSTGPRGVAASSCLNEVRPRRPEQLTSFILKKGDKNNVSMKSGLEGRNNTRMRRGLMSRPWRLNEVRPRRPEQSGTPADGTHPRGTRLNEVRPGRPEQ